MTRQHQRIRLAALSAVIALVITGCNFFGNEEIPYTILDFKGEVVDTAGNPIPGIAIQPLDRYQLPDSIKNDTVKDPSGLAKTITYTDKNGTFALRDKVFSGNSFRYLLLALDVDGEQNGAYKRAIDTIFVATIPGATGSATFNEIKFVMTPGTDEKN